jgi:multiple sugar transport system substrate-binding protein
VSGVIPPPRLTSKRHVKVNEREFMIRNKKRLVKVSAVASAFVLSLTGIASAPVHAAPVKIKVWAWYPNMKEVVEIFNASHTDVQVEWTNVGAGGPHYTKMKTCIKAGKGCPDVAMVEFQTLPTFAILDPFVDMGKYGANNKDGRYAKWAWAQSTSGTRVNAIPVDGGPMAMLYRKDLFEKNNIKVPTTWAEYKSAAEAIKKVNPNQFIATYGNDPGWITGLMWQGGCKPYKYNASASKTNVTIKLNQASCKKVLNYWGDLVTNKLADDKSFWATDTGKGYDTGQYWTWVAAGWTPGYMAGQLKDTVGDWAVAPTPQWTAGADVPGNWGGSSFTVMKQTKNPALATKVAMELFPPQTKITKGSAWDIGLNSAFLYPLVTSVESNPEFANYTYKIFGPTAKVNPIYISASNKLGTFEWTPFQDFIYSTMGDETTLAITGKASWSSVLDTVQKKVVAYAKKQGFKVTQ